MDGKARESEGPHAWGDVQHERIWVSNGKKCGLFRIMTSQMRSVNAEIRPSTAP